MAFLTPPYPTGPRAGLDALPAVAPSGHLRALRRPSARPCARTTILCPPPLSALPPRPMSDRRLPAHPPTRSPFPTAPEPAHATCNTTHSWPGDFTLPSPLDRALLRHEYQPHVHRSTACIDRPWPHARTSIPPRHSRHTATAHAHPAHTIAHPGRHFARNGTASCTRSAREAGLVPA